MKAKPIFPHKFYQSLGKLFYAIAACDYTLENTEFIALEDTLKSHWSSLDVFKTDDIQEISNTFINLQKEQLGSPESYLQDFFIYKSECSHLFNEEINHLILQTANAIASSFSSRNKSELIMLAKLNIELKRNV